MDLRDKIAEKLMRACAHLDDDPECAEMTADAVMRDVVTPMLERLAEERDAARLVSKGRTMGQYDQGAEMKRLRFEEKHLRAELSKCDAENNAAGRRAEQAEAERDEIRDTLDATMVNFEDYVEQLRDAEAERDALKRELTGHTAAFERAWEVHREVCSEAENERLRAERDALKAAIDRVRVRLNELIAIGFGARDDTLRDILAALDTPTPIEETTS